MVNCHKLITLHHSLFIRLSSFPSTPLLYLLSHPQQIYRRRHSKMSFDQQLKVTWLVLAEVSGGMLSGGALCFHEEGYLLTARHVVCDGETSGIQVRSHQGEFRGVDYLCDYPSLDIALLKVKPSFAGEKFEYKSLSNQIQLDAGEDLVTHGHCGGVPFSSRFGKTSYAYKACADLAIQLEDLSLTLKTSDNDVAARIRENFPTPLVRTVAGVVTKDGTSNELLFLHPNLPLIEQNERPGSGNSGCPVFRVADGELMGTIIFSVGVCCYIVPVDVLFHVVHVLNRFS